MQAAIVTSELERSFGDFVAVQGLDLEVPTGSFFGFLGPNGAGKSTTIKMLTRLLRISGGFARVAGRNIEDEPVEVKCSLEELFLSLLGEQGAAARGLPRLTVFPIGRWSLFGLALATNALSGAHLFWYPARVVRTIMGIGSWGPGSWVSTRAPSVSIHVGGVSQ